MITLGVEKFFTPFFMQGIRALALFLDGVEALISWI